MTRFPAAALCLLGSIALAAPSVRAHGIETSLERFAGLRAAMPLEGGDLQVESRFSTGLPASAAAVRLLPPDGGEPIEVGQTDDEGRLRFALPEGARDDWELQVDAGPGHRDYIGLSEDLEPPETDTLSLRPAGWPTPLPVLALGLLGGATGGAILRRRR